jgi:hypothetical protein
LDFGLVEPGSAPERFGGVVGAAADGLVSVSIQRDTSGGRFAVTQVQIYNVVWVDPSKLPPSWRNKGLEYKLILVGTSDGSAPVHVSAGQAVQAIVRFAAPNEATGERVTADLAFTGHWLCGASSLPLTARVSAVDLDVVWELANPFGIPAPPGPTFGTPDPLSSRQDWCAGHVNAVLPITGGSEAGALLVGTNSGGVWLVRTATSSAPDSAEPLSDDWDDPDISCLAQGPAGPAHFYAGASGQVYETNPDQDASIHSWRRITARNYRVIYSVGIVPGSPSRIVLATGIGVFWAEMPPLGSRDYLWRAVTALADGGPFPQGTYSGLAVSSSRVVVAAWGVDIGSGHYGVFHGDWSSGDLLMSRSAMPSATTGQNMYRTSLAACAGNDAVMYAVSSTPDSADQTRELLGALLRSEDGGRSWSLLSPTHLINQTGEKGDYYNCIAVTQTGSNLIVAIGWHFGTFVSLDGGNTFLQMQVNYLDYPISYVHGLTFDAADPSRLALYIASDNGVVVARGAIKEDLSGYAVPSSYDTTGNQRLANLECLTTWVTHDIYGTLSVQGDKVTSGLKNNGIVWSRIAASSTPTPWSLLDAHHDGGVVTVIGTGQMLTDVAEDKILVCRGDVSAGPVRVKGGPNALVWPVLDAVVAPAFKNGSGQLMYAVASPVNTREIYGIFANWDGSDLHAELIGYAGTTASDSISALASLDGTAVLIGTAAGGAFLLDATLSLVGQPNEGTAISVSNDVPHGAMSRILVLSRELAFANYNNGDRGGIIRFAGSNWARSDAGLPGDACYGLASRGTDLILACTDDKVFSSRTQGDVWINASTGLPKRPHCADLRTGALPGDKDIVCLSTFGRSVWVARLA